MKKLFQLIDFNKFVSPKEGKIIPQEEFSKLISGEELIEEIKQDQMKLQHDYDELVKQLRISGEEKGFQAGLEKWTAQLAQLEKQIQDTRNELTKTIVPLALTAVKKIIGRELETKHETIIDIVKTSLKSVAQHKKITIYVNKADLANLESHRQSLKEGFEHLQSLAITSREDVAEGGCIIETEAGIINANLDRQLAALEGAFHAFFNQGSGKA